MILSKITSLLNVNNFFKATKRITESGEKTRFNNGGVIFKKDGKIIELKSELKKMSEEDFNKDHFLFIEFDPVSNQPIKIEIDTNKEERGLEKKAYKKRSLIDGRGLNSGLNSNILFELDSDAEGLHVFLEKDGEDFIIKISNGRVNNENLTDEKIVILRGQYEGQKILLVNEEMELELLDEYTSLIYSRNNEGEWEEPDEMSFKLPIAIIDFENLSFVKIRKSESIMSGFIDLVGINGKSGHSANGY
jgi:hypothetical protein